MGQIWAKHDGLGGREGEREEFYGWIWSWDLKCYRGRERERGRGIDIDMGIYGTERIKCKSVNMLTTEGGCKIETPGGFLIRGKHWRGLVILPIFN